MISKILVEPHRSDAEFRKAWMPFFLRVCSPRVTVDQYLAFVDRSFTRRLRLISLGLLGRISWRWLAFGSLPC